MKILEFRLEGKGIFAKVEILITTAEDLNQYSSLSKSIFHK